MTLNGCAKCRFKDFRDESFFKRDIVFQGQETYIDKTMYLFGSSSGDLREFKPGSFSFKFKYRIPPSVPSSVKAKHGKIRYHVEASLQTGWEFDVYQKAKFTVIRFEDLSYRSDLMQKIGGEAVTSFCCWSCKTKPLNLQASVPFTGYCPGQSIHVTIRIDNRCGFDVYRTVVSFKKVLTFISQTPEHRSWSDSKSLVKNIFEGSKNGKITKIHGVVKVPPINIPTNVFSTVVQVSYLIQVTVDVVGFIQSPKVKLPIVIGSKPLKFENKRF